MGYDSRAGVVRDPMLPSRNGSGSRIKYGARKGIREVIRQVKSSNLNSVAVCAPKFYIAMVPPTGFEPVRSKAKDFKSLMSANSITTAKKTVRW